MVGRELRTSQSQQGVSVAENWLGVVKLENNDSPKLRGWVFMCPMQDCYYCWPCSAQQEAENRRIYHKCPSSPLNIYQGEITLTLVGSMWDEADRTMDELMELMKQRDALKPEDVTDDMKEVIFKLQGRLRGIAVSLSIFMPPFFRTEDECAKEIRNRWRARDSGDKDYETKGIGSLRYDLPRPEAKPISTPATRAAAAPGARPAAEMKLGDKEKAAVKAALSSGLFTAEQLARTYRVSIADVEAVRAS
jgi:hypothetical protein